MVPRKEIIMDWVLTRAEYEKSLVFREDTGDYDCSGYMAVIRDSQHAAIVHIGHCSCYGTWEYGYGDSKADVDNLEGASVVWEGTKRQLLSLARRKADPDMPDRVLSEKDFDAVYLLHVYENVLKWNDQQKSRKK
jgi:hypothetical protein